MTHDLHNQTNVFASSAAASLWWVGDLLYRHGPSWSVVPPLLLGVASVVGAVRGYQNDRETRAIRAANEAQERRHKEEEHRARMAASRTRPQ